MKTTTSYKKIASHEAKKGTFKECILLYSGGLDTSVMLKWIQETYECDIMTLTVDMGQTADDLKAIQEKALKLGAKKAIIHDAQDEFAKTLLSMAIKANVDYQGGYTLSTPLGRIMLTKIAVKYAKQLGCLVIAHGCTGKGNDQVRIEGYITTLDPKLKTIAPVREWGMGRDEEIEYAKKHHIPVIQKKNSPYSYDENMWGNTGEGGEIEMPEKIPPLEKILKWCEIPEKAPRKGESLSITFDQGVPIALNGEKKKLSTIIQECNTLGAKHSIGIVHLIEDRIVGLKVRGVYEQPGATILIAAHKKLEQLVSTREENELKIFMDTKWAYLTYAAKWYDPVMSHINAYINNHNKKVTGTVQVKLYKGIVTVEALSSPYSLFDHNLATFQKNNTFNQNASAGFIEIYNLAQKTAYQIQP